MTNPWDKIFEEDFESAYKIADQNYLQTAQEFDLRARATSLLLLRKYDKSLADFLTLNDIEKQTAQTFDETYMNIGLCYYALDENDKATEYFGFPMTNKKDMKYTSDISVPPAVLLFIAAKLGRQDLIKIATKELKRLSKYKTAAPNFLLGLFTEQDLDKIYKEEPQKTLRNRAQCKAEFYKAVAALRAGKLEKYKEHINSCVKLTGKYPEFQYYIAKVEFDKLNNRGNVC